MAEVIYENNQLDELKEIGKISIVKNMENSCSDLFAAGVLRKTILKIYLRDSEYSNLREEESKDSNSFREAISQITSKMVQQISVEQNGIVMNLDGTLNLESSIEQSKTLNNNIPNTVVREAIRQQQMSEIQSKIIEEFSNDLISGMDTFQINDMFSIMDNINDVIENYSDEQFLNSLMKNNAQEYIQDISQSSKASNSFYESIMKSWICSKEQLHKMIATDLAIKSQSDVKYKEEFDTYISQHPECAYIINENGMVTHESLSEFSEFSNNLMKAKLYEYYCRDSEENIKFEDMSDEQKVIYLKNTLIGLKEESDHDLQKMAIARLSCVSSDLIIQNEKTGKIELDSEKFLKIYNSFSKTSKEESVDELYIKSAESEKSKFISEKLKLIEENEDTLEEIDPLDKSTILNQINSKLEIDHFSYEISDEEFEFDRYAEEIRFDEKYRNSNKEQIIMDESKEESVIKNNSNSIFSRIKRFVTSIKNRLNGVKYLETKNGIIEESTEMLQNDRENEDSFRDYVEIKGEQLKKYNRNVQNIITRNEKNSGII